MHFLKIRGLHSYSPNVENVSHSGMSQLFATPGAVACQSPLSMGFSRKEYWSGLPFPFPVTLPDFGIKPESLTSPALAGGFFTTEPPGKPTEVCGTIREKENKIYQEV